MIDASDKTRFASLLAGVSEYYGKELSENVANLYWTALKNHSYEEVADAFSRHMANPDNGQFMPKIADVKRLIDGSNFGKSAIAWSKVDKAIRQVGPYASVVFDDPIIHQVLIDLGGWININMTTEDDLKFKANEFQKRYQSYQISGGVQDYPKKLTGISEAENTKNGYLKHARNEYRAIGNEDVARLVYKEGKDDSGVSIKSIEDLSESAVKRLQ